MSLVTPSEIILFVTNRCNLRCAFCCNGDVNQPGPELTLDEIRQLAKTFPAPLKRLIISGGEPSLRDDLAEILGAFYDANGVRKIDIPFNGFSTDVTVQRVTEILKRCPQVELTVDLSLDGPEDVHNAGRGNPGAFQATVKTLAALLALKDRDPRFRIFLNTVVSPLNLDSLKAFCTWVRTSFPGVDYHSLILVRDSNTRGQRRPLGLSVAQIRQARRLIMANNFHYFRKRSWRYRFFQLLVTWMWTDMALRTSWIGRSYFHCLAYKLNRTIYADGRIGICEMLSPFADLKDYGLNITRMETALQTAKKPLHCSCMHACFFCPSVRYYPLNVVFYVLDMVRSVWPFGPREKRL